MIAREKNKNHLHETATILHEIVTPKNDEKISPLQFWTMHDKNPTFVDLSVFALGTPEKKPTGKWSGHFSGRPELTKQLAPAIHEHLQYSPKDTAESFIKHLRWWWRLFDSIELVDNESEVKKAPITDVKCLSDLHRQVAIDAGATAHHISNFQRVANITRRALGLRDLYWAGPTTQEPKRHLPPLNDFKRIWRHLKRRWFSTIDRWRRAEQLLVSKAPLGATEIILLKNYLHFNKVEARLKLVGRNFPAVSDIKNGISKKRYAEYSSIVMYEGHYPNPHDIRVALHLCLAGCGWNPQPLLDLKVDSSLNATTRTPFLHEHPADSSRYVLRSKKNRGKLEVINTGHWKTERSPGAIILELVNRTWPLRLHVLQELAAANEKYRLALADGSEQEEINSLRLKVIALEKRSISPWLYISFKGAVEHLEASTFNSIGTKKEKQKYRRITFLEIIVNEVNEKMNLQGTEKVPYIVASDFRDSFATFTWEISGGSVLHVMKALNHNSPNSTTKYLDNSLINGEGLKKFLTFSNTFFEQIQKGNRIDITIIAKITEDGYATTDEQRRLVEYRSLKKSRIGIGCKDPYNPPERVEPNFRANGILMCTNHRCTLCFENGVILPESLEGLSMRMAELRWLKANIPIEAFILKEYQQEYENTELALKIFPQEEVEKSISIWEKKISAGVHRPIEFQSQILKRYSS